MKKTAMQQIKSIIIGLKSKGQEIDTNGLEDWINRVGEPMEKDQIIDAIVWARDPYGRTMGPDILSIEKGEKYYNQIFKSE